MKKKSVLSAVVAYTILIVAAVLTLAPFSLSIMTALRAPVTSCARAPFIFRTPRRSRTFRRFSRGPIAL